MSEKFGFVLAGEFTLSPLAMFVDVLRLAGDEGDRSRRVLFDWQIVGDRGLPIRSSSGFELMPTLQFGDPSEFDHVVLVGGLLGPAKTLGGRKERFIIDAAQKGVPITALCTASFHLARLGLLDGYRVCVSLFHLQQFQDEFPNVAAEATSLFSVDRDRATCAGGAGAADLASHYVRELVGAGPVEKAAKILQLDRVRSTADPQPKGDIFPDARSRTVRRALLLMRGAIAEDIDVSWIAQRLGVSRRQVERLFSAELRTSPKPALQAMRVECAKTLLRQTDFPMVEIAAKCGFTSSQQFSKVFSRVTGRTPTETRMTGTCLPPA